MTRTIRINADYLSETTIAKYINPVVSGEGTIELPPVVSIPGIISYFSQDNSVMLKMTKDLTMEKLKEQKRYLPEDLISLLAFAILQGFSYIECTRQNSTERSFSKGAEHNNFSKVAEHNNLNEGDNTMKNLTELLKSKDVGTTEGLVNLFVSAAVRGAVTTFVFFVIEGIVFVVTKSLRK